MQFILAQPSYQPWNIIYIRNQQKILRILTVLVFKNCTSGPILEPKVDEILYSGQRVTYQIDAQMITNHLEEEKIPTTVKPAGKNVRKNRQIMPFFMILPVVLTAIGIFSYNELMMR